MTGEDVLQLVAAQAEAITKEIVEGWRRIAETEVWLALPPAMTFDDLPNVVRAVAGAALMPRFQTDECELVVLYSSIHGDHRSTEGFPESCIHTEYHLLRRSLWDLLRTRLDTGDAVRSITRVDAVITLATMAALRGFHCQTFQQRNDWPAARDRLLTEWPLVGD